MLSSLSFKCWTLRYWVIFVGIYLIKYRIIHKFEAWSVAKLPYHFTKFCVLYQWNRRLSSSRSHQMKLRKGSSVHKWQWQPKYCGLQFSLENKIWHNAKTYFDCLPAFLTFIDTAWQNYLPLLLEWSPMKLHLLSIFLLLSLL